MKIQIMIICLGMYLNGFSQTNTFKEETIKYWYYRDRLKYFVMPGSQAGQSVLFSSRNSSRYNWDGTPFSMDVTQPHMMMGFYVGMLATEYKLLKNNGQETSSEETLVELNLALDALIRMDKCEDEIPWLSNNEIMDGFFVREDLPSSLSSEMEIYFNKDIDDSFSSHDIALTNPGLPTTINKDHVRCAMMYENPQNYFSLNVDYSDPQWSNYWTDNDVFLDYWKRQKFISQDEMIGMLMGLSLVVKCVDDQPTKNKAIDIGGQTVSYCLGNPALTEEEEAALHNYYNSFLNLLDIELNFFPNKLGYTWLRYPDGTLISDRSGGNTLGLSRGIVYSGRYITAGCQNQYPEIYQNTHRSQDVMFYFALSFLEMGPCTNKANNLSMMSRLLAISGHSDYRTLKHLGDCNKFDVFYMLLRAVLHNGDLRNISFFNKGRMLDQLQTAPCGGPYKFFIDNGDNILDNQDNIYPNGWATYLKFQTDVESQNGGHEHDGDTTLYAIDDKGIFSGIDYMLFYNLACLAFPNGFESGGQQYSFPYYVNQNDRVVTAYYPYLSSYNGGTYYGSMATPEEIRAISTITSSMKVLNQALNPNDLTYIPGVYGDVTLKAGESIRLTDGFRVDAGAHFLAKIESYSCEGVSYKNMEAPPWGENYRGCFYDTLVSIPMDKRAPMVYTDDNYEEDDFDMPLWNDYYTYDTTAMPELVVGAWLNPNPCQSTTNLTLVSETDQFITIELFDVNGQKRETVFEGNTDLNLTQSIDMSTYAEGIYILRLTGISGTKVIRLVKE